ncbi:MAG: hypothetical protein COA40_14250 [Aequorivita sp.]|nr:MAG: hypothetical protein COA40_14250 [Aequorivita sp.]
MECASQQRGKRKRNVKQKLRTVSKNFLVKLFSRNEAFRGMQGKVLNIFLYEFFNRKSFPELICFYRCVRKDN